MITSVLFDGDIAKGEEIRHQLALRTSDVVTYFTSELRNFSGIRYLISFASSRSLVEKMPDLQVIFSTGAGIDQLYSLNLPSRIKIVRMMDPGITAGVVEYVVLAILALHRDLPHYLRAANNRTWKPMASVAASERRVGIMGLGIIGRAVIGGLAPFDFQIAGWSREPKNIDGVQCYSGLDELPDFLSRTDILVCALPLTVETKGILSATTFNQLPSGAMLINVGRGAHLIADDLLFALETRQLSNAILDVCDPEPLPHDHPFWRHPRILLTPHIAGRTRAEAAAEHILASILDHQRGYPMAGIVNRANGY